MDIILKEIIDDSFDTFLNKIDVLKDTNIDIYRQIADRLYRDFFV